MNQVTNKVSYGLLSKEERAQFGGEAKARGMYEYHSANVWESTADDTLFSSSNTYRLIIKHDEWYYWENSCGYSDTQKGGSLNEKTVKFLSTLRLANPAEIQAAKPKVESLEDRVKAEYGDEFEVVMLEWSRINVWSIQSRQGLVSHAIAQSMKGFYRYVYENPEPDKSLCHLIEPVWLCDYEPILPIAVLFTKEK